MGIVYIVYDRKAREVFAAKTFQDEVFARNPNTKEQFEKEALAWINLDLHENITQANTLHFIGGKPFLFLEYVSGGDLGRWIGTPNLLDNLPRVLRFGIQFCDGMQHIISKGIKAHRDIKPQNCLLTSSGTLKITDFGLVKVFDDAIPWGNGDASAGQLIIGVSQTGTAAGTCTHMSPEQFEDSKRVDLRADIYSFGVLMFQMVTGELPFVGRSFMEFAEMHIRHTPPVHKIANHRIRSIVEKCLRKKAQDRYGDFETLRRDLASLYESQTGFRTPNPATGDELTAFHLVNKGKALGDLGLTDDSLTCFDKAISLNPSLAEAWLNKGASLSEKGQNAEAIRCFDRALTIKPDLGVAWANKGHVLIELGRTEEAVASFQRAHQLNPHDATILFHQALTLAKLDKHEDAVAAYDKVVRLNPKHETAWFNMAHSMGLLGRHEDVIKCCTHALEISPRFTDAWYLRGVALSMLHHFPAAIENLEKALQLGCEPAKQAIANCRQGIEIDAVCKEARALVAKGTGMSAYLILNEAVKKNETNPNLWFTMAFVLSHDVERYGEQALTAANNALFFHKQNPELLTPNDFQALKQLQANLSARN